MTDNGKTLVIDAAARLDEGGLTLRVDGTLPMSAAPVKAIQTLCDRAEDHGGPGIVGLYVSGAPDGSWAWDADVAVVTKWERALQRFERLAMTTVAVAAGDCGGLALDALLATDFRVATGDVRLSIPVDGAATWPGMAVYRLAQQAGVAQIRRAVLFGAAIDAAEALGLRLIDELADDPDSALAVAEERLGSFSGTELAIRRRLMLDATTTSFDDALGSHLAACDRALRQATAKAAP